MATDTVHSRIGAAGGSLTLTSANGTRYELTVPPDALPGEVDITATSVASFGLGDGEPQGVVFQPSGLFFAKPATLAVTPGKAIPGPRQLIFTFADDGSTLLPAEPAMDSDTIKIVVSHFTGSGVADLVNTARDKYVNWRADNALERLEERMQDALAVERQRELLGDDSGSAAVNKLIDQSTREYERDVVAPLIEGMARSCATAKRAIASLTYANRLRQLRTLNRIQTDVDLPGFWQAWRSGVDVCEKEAKARCRDAHDPKILIQFWTNANRDMQLNDSQGVELYPLAGMQARAEASCDPQAYQIVGGLEDWHVDVKVCDITKPFVLHGSIGTMTLSGGLTGTYEMTGDFSAKYTGTYVITFPDGPRRPGTMEGEGSGSIGGQAGSGKETYTLTPLGPAC
jgi:hypothetical protein